MTSGQGENQPGGPYGPPQGWNAPPSPEVYGQQYPGYARGPSAPTGYGAPQSMERPTTVRAGIGAFVASLLVGLIVVGRRPSPISTPSSTGRSRAIDGPRRSTEEVIRAILSIGIVIGLVMLALNVLFMWFAWKGHNWARIVLWVLGGLGVASGLFGLAGANGQTGFTTVAWASSSCSSPRPASCCWR